MTPFSYKSGDQARTLIAVVPFGPKACSEVRKRLCSPSTWRGARQIDANPTFPLVAIGVRVRCVSCTIAHFPRFPYCFVSLSFVVSASALHLWPAIATFVACVLARQPVGLACGCVVPYFVRCLALSQSLACFVPVCRTWDQSGNRAAQQATYVFCAWMLHLIFVLSSDSLRPPLVQPSASA